MFLALSAVIPQADGNSCLRPVQRHPKPGSWVDGTAA
jgi:hypothetical protein